MEFVALLLATATIFWMFSFGEGEVRPGQQSGFPPHMFTLPIRTVHLVSIRSLCGVVVLLSFYCAWSAVIFPAWGIPFPRAWLPAHLLALTCMMVSTQAVIWSLYTFTWMRFLVLAAVLIGLGFLGVVVPSDDFRLMSPGALAGVFIGLTVIAWILAILGVARDRRGEWVGWTGKLVSRIMDAVPARRNGFTSSARAQLWFEWRRKGFLCSLMFALPIAGALVPLPLGPLLNPDRPGSFLLSVPLWIWMMASTVGQGLAKSEYGSNRHGIGLFVATRPLATGDLVMAKLKGSTLAIFIGLTLATVFAPATFSAIHWLWHPDLEVPSWNEYRQLNQEAINWASQPVIWLLLLGMTWHSMVSGLSIGLLADSRKITAASFIGMFVFAGTISAGFWLYNHPDWQPALLPIIGWIAAILAAIKILSAWLSFRSAWNRSLLSTKHFWVLAGIWLALAGIIAAASTQTYLANMVAGPVLLFLAAYLLPGSELPNCAIHMANDRHR